MAQYIEGTVDVTNGSAVVTGTGTEWLANAAPGDFFLLQGAAAAQVIQTVDTDVQLTLSTNFAGTTAVAQQYAIHRDFSAQGFPILREGDVFFSQVWARFLIQLEGLLAGTINVTGTFPVWHTLASGPPSAGLGNDGDLALIENGDVYTKDLGAWTFFANIGFNIANLDPATQVLGTDELVAQTGSGPVRITRDAMLPRRNDLPTLDAQGLNLGNDFIWVWDGTDQLPHQISVRELVFGNHRNERYASRATALVLSIAADNVRPIECDGTWTAPDITLDGNAANIGGAFFTIINSTTDDLTLTAINGITLLVNGQNASAATIRQGFAAGVNVNNAGDQGVFVGG